MASFALGIGALHSTTSLRADFAAATESVKDVCAPLKSPGGPGLARSDLDPHCLRSVHLYVGIGDFGVISNFKYVKQAIKESSRDDFARLVGDLFGPFLPGLFETRRLGELDGLGSDLIDFSSSGRVRLVIQCKGFEKPNFEDSQLDQCLAEIEKYRTKGIETEAYWLALNRAVTDPDHRKAIRHALDSLVATGKVQETLLLDFSQLRMKLEAVVRECLVRWAHLAQARLAAIHTEHLTVVEYLPDVPFVNGHTNSQNPSRHFVARAQSERARRPETQYGKDRRPPRMLLKGSFGFGKTSALLAATAVLGRDGVHPIFMRGADMKDAATYASGHGLLLEILKTITPDDNELSPLAVSLAVDALREELKSSDTWALFIDAIDESPFSNDMARITALWGGVIDVGLPVFVSVRTELVDQRESEFTLNPKTREPTLFEVIALKPWSDDLIGEFLENFSKARPDSPSELFLELQKLVREGLYEAVYGDIPRRPLFLGMLAEDAWMERETPNRLSDLYEHYFIRKFERDVYGSGHSRPFELLSREGVDETLRRLFNAMENVAFRLNRKFSSQTNDAAKPAVGSHLTRSELDDVLFESGLQGVLNTEFSLHSVVVPAGRDRRTREQLFRFAHASFEDYFAARWLWRNEIAPTANANDAVRRFYSEMHS